MTTTDKIQAAIERDRRAEPALPVYLIKSPMYRAHRHIMATDPHSDSWNSYVRVAQDYPYALPENALRFDNAGDMIRRVRQSGSHFYDADAIRFFKGRNPSELHANRFWVDSVRYPSSDRLYRVAWAYRYGSSGMISIERIGAYFSLDKARAACRLLVDCLPAEARS